MSELSPKQLEANRKNASFGGVKTERGKQVSKLNALKYGILSKEIFAGMEKGEREEFINFNMGMINQLGPVGPMEEILADRIAVGYWRLRRVIRAETGEIKKNQDTLAVGKKIFELDREGETFKNSVDGIKKLINIIEFFIERVEDGQELFPHELMRLSRHFGIADTSITSYAYAYNRIMEKEPDGSQMKEFGKGIFTAQLSTKLEELNGRLKLFLEKEKLEAHAKFLAASLPDREVLEKLSRYERHLEKSVSRATHELMRLQAIRLGQKFLPILQVDVDIDQNS